VPRASLGSRPGFLVTTSCRDLADLHVNYEQQREYPLERIEKGQLNWRVEKMRLSKDKTTLAYNDFLTLKGIPAETYEYRLGNRSALEWVIDQYQVSTDKRSTGAPNNGVFCGCWGGGASLTIPIAPTIPNTSCASSARSSPSAWKR
jgi:predicted helicase